jgi:hypothetical protein
MKSGKLEPFIHRTYGEGGAFQWVRETIVNAAEAGATKVRFEIEPQGFKADGIKRLMISDDGCGMTPDEMRGYLNTFGAGSKTIEGAHDNYGFGAKTSLLPWNHMGVVIVSRRDGIDAMVWLHRDPESHEYGLKILRSGEDQALESVFEPFPDPKLHIDWSQVLPESYEHGTAVVLLGSHDKQETIFGDPNRSSNETSVNQGEAAERGIIRYINGRFFDLNIKIAVSQANGTIDHATGLAVRLDQLTSQSGSLLMPDGSLLKWFLAKRENGDNASVGRVLGKISVKYRDELYGHQSGPAPFRVFGIVSADVRKRLAIVITPPELSDSSPNGVRPDASRGTIGRANGEGLPISEWGAAFQASMPQEIKDAIAESTISSKTNPRRRKALAERLNVYYRGLDRPIDKGLGATETVTGDGDAPFNRSSRIALIEPACASAKPNGNGSPRKGIRRPGKKQGTAGLPDYRFVSDGDLESEMVAAVNLNVDPPLVDVNRDHRFIAEAIDYWSERYSDIDGVVTDQVAEEFGLHLTQVVAGVLGMKKWVSRDQLENQLLSPEALTTSVAGFVCDDKIGAVLSQKTTKRSTQPFVLQANQIKLSDAADLKTTMA